MNHRPLLSVLFLVALSLTACNSKPAKGPTPVKPAPVKQVKTPAVPSHLRILSGALDARNGALPIGGEIELALLIVDGRGRPNQLLSSEKVTIGQQPQSFKLMFNPLVFPQGGDLRVELHARAVHAGRLLWILPPWRVGQPITQSAGTLWLVPAP